MYVLIMLLLYQVDQGDALAALELRHQPPQAVHRLRRLRPALLPRDPRRTVAGMSGNAVTWMHHFILMFAVLYDICYDI